MNIPRPYELISAMTWKGRRKTLLLMILLSTKSKIDDGEVVGEASKKRKWIVAPPPMSKTCERRDDVSTLYKIP